jgi:hypothetical protein
MSKIVPPSALSATTGNGPAQRFIHGMGTPANSDELERSAIFWDSG